MGSFYLDHCTQLTKTATVVPLTSYDASTDFFFDVRGMNRKGILIQNVGATGATGTFSVLGSLDDMKLDTGNTGAATFEARAAARQTPNVAWDITHLGDTTVAPAGQTFAEFSNNYTFVKVRVKSAGDTTMVVKAVASSN